MTDLLHTLIPNAVEMFAILDRDGVAIYQSPAIEQMLGVSPGEKTGNPIWELVHPEDVDHLQRVLEAVVADGGVHSVRFQLRHVDRSWHILDGTVRLLGGRADADVVLRFHDTTEQLRIEAALK